MMSTYTHRFTHAIYFLPAITLEWTRPYRDGKETEFTLGFEWLVWGFYVEKG